MDPDPTAAANYSPGFRIGDLVVVSGQAALDAHSRTVGAGDFDAQAAQVFANLRRVLRGAGSDLEQVVKVTTYLNNMAHFRKISALRAQQLTAPYPADTIVEFRVLTRPELTLEIEAIALVGGTLAA
nr:RidA family protein [Patulibacter sp. SYSU D01012]